MKPKLFIDGEHGTTGLQIRQRIAGRDDIEVLSIPEAERRNQAMREELLKEADIAILCLPDDAARESVAMCADAGTRIIDASTAHRVAEGWTYGFPEMDAGQAEKIAGSRYVCNPGCWPQGPIAMLRPLVKAGLVPADYPVTFTGITGYSGGGKAMIHEFEDSSSEAYTRDNHRIYALGQAHKHPPEMKAYARLEQLPLFMPSVGRYAQGMIVEIGLPLWAVSGKPKRAQLHTALSEAYAGERFVNVVPLAEADRMKGVEPEACNGTNRMDLFVFGSDDQARLVARFDNLGKGASGAAVQNLNIALGLEEDAGLTA